MIRQTESKFTVPSNSFGMSDPVVKFTPVTGTDTMVMNGVTQTISTRLHCITEMKEYGTKSLEELRLEDYERKGQNSAAFFAATPTFPLNDKVFFKVGHSGSTENVSKAFRTRRPYLQAKRLTDASAFEQPQLTIQVTPFGQTANTTNTVPFTIANTPFKFIPVTETDTMVWNGVTRTISTRYHCITCMKVYETKSLEELRLQDYAAGRKGAQSDDMFGAKPQASPFGGVATQAQPTNTAFGGMTTGFGATSQATTSNLFSKPLTGFGASTTTTSAFTFNNAANTNTSNIFNTQAKPFGATTATPLFSSSNTANTQNTTFGRIVTQNTGFGGAAFGATQQPNQSIDLFNQNKPAFNLPASTASSSFGFGQTSQANTGGLFGTKPIGTGFGMTATRFGTTQTQNTSSFNSNFKPACQQTSFSFGDTPAAPASLGTIGTALFSAISKSTTIESTDAKDNDNSTVDISSSKGDSIAASPQQNTDLIQQQILELARLQKELLSALKMNEQIGKPSSFEQEDVSSSTQYKTGPVESRKKEETMGEVQHDAQQNIDAIPPVHQRILSTFTSALFGDPPLSQYFSQACFRFFLFLDRWIMGNWIL